MLTSILQEQSEPIASSPRSHAFDTNSGHPRFFGSTALKRYDRKSRAVATRMRSEISIVQRAKNCSSAIDRSRVSVSCRPTRLQTSEERDDERRTRSERDTTYTRTTHERYTNEEQHLWTVLDEWSRTANGWMYSSSLSVTKRWVTLTESKPDIQYSQEVKVLRLCSCQFCFVIYEAHFDVRCWSISGVVSKITRTMPLLSNFVLNCSLNPFSLASKPDADLISNYFRRLWSIVHYWWFIWLCRVTIVKQFENGYRMSHDNTVSLRASNETVMVFVMISSMSVESWTFKVRRGCSVDHKKLEEF